MKGYMRVGGRWTLYPGVVPPLPLLTMFIGTRQEKLFPASSWRAFRNFKWPGSSQSLWSLYINERIHEGWVCVWGGDTLPQGRLPPPPPPLTICFQHPLEGHSETSNGQAFLIPFDHYIKMKVCTMVGGGVTLPQGRVSPSTTGKFWLCS